MIQWSDNNINQDTWQKLDIYNLSVLIFNKDNLGGKKLLEYI